VGEALALPLSAVEEEGLLPYLKWPREEIYQPLGGKAMRRTS
jgi:hypothetical protein